MDYTVVLTSCNRHHYLKQTLDSFVEFADIFPIRTVIVEDSATPRPDWLTYPELGEIIWIQNGERRGQGYAIDAGYAQCQTEFLFHMEDDRTFIRKGPFIEESAKILTDFPEVSSVQLTAPPQWLVNDPRYPFPVYKPSKEGLNTVYDGIAFANGLRRLSLYKKFGGDFARYERDKDVKTMKFACVELYVGAIYRDAGYIIADLGVAYTGHIGVESPYLHGGN